MMKSPVPAVGEKDLHKTIKKCTRDFRVRCRTTQRVRAKRRCSRESAEFTRKLLELLKVTINPVWLQRDIGGGGTIAEFMSATVM